MGDPLALVSPLVAAAALGALWAVESVAPFFLHDHHHGGRAAHGLRNAALGAINGGLRMLVFPVALLAVSGGAAEWQTGLLHLLRAPGVVELLLAILLLDAWNYAWHIACHKLPVLWRFHTVHHHDDAVDTSTAFRFHTGDILMCAAATLAAVVVLGLTIQQVLVYELVLLPASLFHHSNIRLPERVDRVLRAVVVTPRMHWVHHSRWQPETDSNYSSIFSFWDRLFGTMRLRRDPASLELGLDGYSARETGTIRGCLATPIGPVKSLPGRPPVEAGLPDAERSRGPHPGRAGVMGVVPAMAHAPGVRGAPARTLGPCPPKPQHPPPA